MHEIAPFYRWEKYYQAAEDKSSPFYGREYSLVEYTHDIYGYYIHPQWDWIGSETLYIKLLFADYKAGCAIIEMLGEWNDTLHNDIMYLKRNVIDHLSAKGINKFILIGENVLIFHGSDDCYYEEWFEDVEDGWVVAINFRDSVKEEWEKFNIDWYLNFGGTLDTLNWRTMKPQVLFEQINGEIGRRLGS